MTDLIFDNLPKNDEGIAVLNFKHHLTLRYRPGQEYEAKLVNQDGETTYAILEIDTLTPSLDPDAPAFIWNINGEQEAITRTTDFRFVGRLIAVFAYMEQYSEIRMNF